MARAGSADPAPSARWPRRTSQMAWLFAIAVWALAILGAAGVAYLLGLDRLAGIALIGLAALIAFFGSFLPVLRLGKARSRNRHTNTDELSNSNRKR